MVSIGVFSLLLPGIIMAILSLGAKAKEGVNRNIATTDARYLQQFFVKTINASNRDICTAANGNSVTIHLYNKSTKAWEEAALCFLEESSSLVYIPPTADGVEADTVEIAAPVHKCGTNDVFSPEGAGVRCKLYAGKFSPENPRKTGGYFITPGVFIDLFATPRNTGGT